MDAKTWNMSRPGRRGGVDVLSKRAEPRALRLDGVHDVETIARRAGEAGMPGDGNHVALTQPIELEPAARRAGDLVSEPPAGTRRLRGADLAVRVLVVRADAGMTDGHVAVCRKTSQNHKGLS
jgi:hypothetical protein